MTDEEEEEIVHAHMIGSGSDESCKGDKMVISTGCDEHSETTSGIGSSVTGGGRNSSSSGSTSMSGGLFDPETLPNKIADLRRDLLSLITLDNELFKNLLTINDTIEEMKDQRLANSTSNLKGRDYLLITCPFLLIRRKYFFLQKTHFYLKLGITNGKMETPQRSGNFILNGGRPHKRSKSSGKASSKSQHQSSTTKFYDDPVDELNAGKSDIGRTRFFEVYENQQR